LNEVVKVVLPCGPTTNVEALAMRRQFNFVPPKLMPSKNTKS